MAACERKPFALKVQPSTDRVDFSNEHDLSARPLLDLNAAIQLHLGVLMTNPRVAMNIDLYVHRQIVEDLTACLAGRSLRSA